VLYLDPHPLLDLRALTIELPAPIEGLASPPALTDRLRPDAAAPFHPDEAVNKAVRDLLRRGGYKPTGRGKPASEYLARAAGEGTLGSINAAADAGNAASLHSGLPISVVDLDRLSGQLRVALGRPGDRYVFNPAGHDIDVEGLLCLFDDDGPCANAVKDAQRTKTGPETRRLLALVWGTVELPGLADRTAAWLTQLYQEVGAQVTPRPASLRSA
jgi:DNA/RNA-binding domain of Phe-tRNA-synthetase-like protein